MKTIKKITVPLTADFNHNEIREWVEKVSAAATALENLLANPPCPQIIVSLGEPAAEPEPDP